jgi:hypothetical protein
VLFALGLVHGPLLPVQGALKARWCYGEPFALQLIRFGRTLSDFTLPLTGVLAARLGWPVVPCGIAVLGGLFSVVWHRLAAERPGEEPVTRDDAEQTCRATLGSGTGSEAGSETATAAEHQPPVEWGIFHTAQAQAVILAHIAANNNTLEVWSIPYYIDALGCTPMQAGFYHTLPAIAQNVAAWAAAAGVAMGDRVIIKCRSPLNVLKFRSNIQAVIAVIEHVEMNIIT